MKKKAVLLWSLYALTAFFPVVYACCKIFADGYTPILHSADIFAAVFGALIAGICIALLCIKDKSVNRGGKILLILSAILLPLSRFVLIMMMDEESNFILTWRWFVYIGLEALLIVTMCFYIKNDAVTVLSLIAFALVFSATSVYLLFYGMFGYTEVRQTDKIASPYGGYSAVVKEFTNSDDGCRYKKVSVYNSEESFFIGSLEFRKSEHRIERYQENTDALDIDSDIVWLEYDIIRIKDKSYYSTGEEVTEPPEPPL